MPTMRQWGALLALCAIAMIAAYGCGRKPADVDATTPSQPESVELQPRTIPVFCYHAMEPDASGTYEVATEDFKEQLAAMNEAGYETVTPTQLADYYEGKAELPDKPVCITFDDGPSSILTVSKPLMDEYGYIGAAFLISTSVGGEDNLSWDDVRELEAAGWDIGSHTACHIHATRVSGEKCAEELEASKATIDDEIEGECVALAYPYGLYDEETLDITKDAGYRIAFTIDRGPADQTDDPFLVPREMVVNGNSLRTFGRWLAQEKLHLEEIDPPRGHRFDMSTPQITARLADDIAASEIEFTVAGKAIDVDVAEDGVTLTLNPELSTGANIIRANYWGSPQRETSWVVVCDAD